MSDLNRKVAEALSLVSEELDAQRDEIRNANRPVLEKLGGTERKLEAVEGLLQQVLQELRHDREDFEAFKKATNDRFRKEAANGAPRT